MRIFTSPPRVLYQPIRMHGRSYSIRGTERQPLSGEAGRSAIEDEISWQIANPPSGDKVISYMWQGLRHVMPREAEWQRVFDRYATSQRVIAEPWTDEGRPASSATGHLRTGIQFICMRDGIVPQTVLGWIRSMTNAARNPASMTMLETVLDERLTNTAVGDRYGPVEVDRQLTGTGNFVDCGSSVPVGSYRTQRKDRFPFPVIQFRLPDGRPDRLASLGYANLIGRPAMHGQVITGDRFRPDDRMTQRLAMASMRPSEIMDIESRRYRRQLLRPKLPNVIFVQADITNRNSMAELRERCQGLRIRLACLITVLHQVGQENVDPAIDNVLDLLEEHPESKLIIAENAQVDRRRRRRHVIYLAPRWAEGTYGYFEIAKMDPGRQARLLYALDSTRARSGIAENGLSNVRGEQLPMREYLIRAAGEAAVNPVARPPRALNTLS